MTGLGLFTKGSILLGGICLFGLLVVLTDGWILPVVAIVGFISVMRLKQMGCFAKGCVLIGAAFLGCAVIAVTYSWLLPKLDRWHSMRFARAHAVLNAVCARPIPASLVVNGRAAFSRTSGVPGVGRDVQYAIRFDTPCDEASLVAYVFGVENVKDEMWAAGSEGEGYVFRRPSFMVSNAFIREWAKLEERVEGWTLPYGTLARIGGHMYSSGYRVTLLAFPCDQGQMRVFIFLEGGHSAGERLHVGMLHIAGPKPDKATIAGTQD